MLFYIIYNVLFDILLGSVKAYDVEHPQKGVVFYIPITVVKPIRVTNEINPSLYFTNVNFKPNTIKRYFILVPERATWASKYLINASKSDKLNITNECVEIYFYCRFYY